MAKQSPLMDLHRENGAFFAEYDGWLLPAHFGDVAAEYRRLRAAVGLVDLSQRALLQFTGADRLSFLQGMLSNDLRNLKPFDAQYTTILTQQGKVVADVRVLCATNSFYLDFWESRKDRVVEHLNRYLVADDVEIADRSAEYTLLSVQGPSSELLLKRCLGDPPLPANLRHGMIEMAGAAICVVRQDRGTLAFDLVIPCANVVNVARKLAGAGEQFSAGWVGENAQNILRVESGIPRYGTDFNESNLLLEVGIEHALSFSKGCYLGQEVVERIRSRGHVNRKLCGLLLDGSMAAAAGDLVQTDGKTVGTITSSVLSPRCGRPIALGYLGKDHWNSGTRVSVQHNHGLIDASVADLPFVGSS